MTAEVSTSATAGGVARQAPGSLAPEEVRLYEQLLQLARHLGMSQPRGDLSDAAVRIVHDLEERGRLHGSRSEAQSPHPDDLVLRLMAQMQGVFRDRSALPVERRNDSSERRFEERARRAQRTLDVTLDKLDGAERQRPPGHRGTLSDPASAPPANDDCAGATPIDNGTFNGDTAAATVDGSASCGSSLAAPDVWFHYTAPADGLVTFDTFGSIYDTVVSLHDGCPGTTANELDCDDDSGGTAQSEAAKEMITGEEVWVRVSGFNGATGPFDLEVQTSNGISGTVTKVGGDPVEGAYVYAYSSTGYYEREARTKSDGTYLIAGLDSGDYFVLVWSNAYVNEVYDDVVCLFCDVTELGSPVPVGNGVTAGIDFELETPGSITGLVTEDDGGAPLAGTYVEAMFPDGMGTGVRTYTNQLGRYSLTGLSAGEFIVQADHYEFQPELYDDIACTPYCDPSSGTAISVASGSTTAGIDFALQRLGAITGTVTGPGGSPIATTVSAHRQDGTLVRYGSSSWLDGSYTLAALPDGSYFVRTETYEYQDEVYDDIVCNLCDPSVGTPVPVSLNITATNIDFELRRLGSIAATVTDAETGEGIHGYLALHDSNGSLFRSEHDSTGVFSITSLPSGSYYARTDLHPAEHAIYETELFDDIPCDPDCEVTTGYPIPVALDTTTVIDFSLQRCPFESFVAVEGVILLGILSRTACRTVRVGPNVVVESGGELHLTARESAVFHNGFSVLAGGRLRVVIDPTAGEP